MKLLVVGRGAPGYAEGLAIHLEEQLGFACGGRSFEMDGAEPKMQRASLTAGFADIADAVEQAIVDDIAFRRSRVVLVSAQGEASADPVPDALVATDQTYWLNLVALLVLAFPDVHWVIATSPAEHQAMTAAGLELHSVPGAEIARLGYLVRLRSDGYEPLYDPTGIRNIIKRQSFAKLKILTKFKGKVQCPAREQLALVMDDEIEVAAAVAYLHYRQGYRTLCVTTENQLCDAAHAPRFSRTAESFTIRFPDASPEDHELDLQRRLEILPQLKDASGSRFVYTIDDGQQEVLAAYDGVQVIRRPFDGFEGFAGALKLSECKDFAWPPANPVWGKTPGQHAMPGFLTMAARRLLLRSGDVSCPAHHQALFALEAQELVLNRVPSLSLEAHRQRVCAELRLEGEVSTLLGGSASSAHSRIGARYKQLQTDIDSMLEVIDKPDEKRRAQLRDIFGSQLLGTMIDRYRQGYHFREELATLAHQRDIDLRGPNSYFALVLRRPRNLVGAVLLLTSLFAVAYLMVAMCSGTAPSPAMAGRSFLISLFMIVSIGLPPDEMFGSLTVSHSLAFQILATFECMVGLLHWGLGFAHLYTLVSRR